ncbi:MAG: hypothetical protein ABR579_09630 [Actinomycetota bacterium]
MSTKGMKRLIVVVALVLAGCTGGKPATAPSPRPAKSFQAGMLAYTQCLRSKGVSVEPPVYGSDGQIVRWIDLEPGTDSDTLSSAENACQSKLPRVDAGGSQSSETKQFLAAATRFVNCMRSNGVPDMPDPTERGLVLQGSGVDPHTRQFQAAQKKCQHFLDKVGG